MIITKTHFVKQGLDNGFLVNFLALYDCETCLHKLYKIETRPPFLFLSSAPTDMRYSMDLCEEENDFRQKRKNVVFQAMKKLLGERGPKTLDEVD